MMHYTTIMHFSYLILISDPEIKQSIITTDSIQLISNLLTFSNPEIILNALTTLIFLIDDSIKPKIITGTNISTIIELSQFENTRIKNLAQLFLDDYCSTGQISLAKKRKRKQ